jgi:hypothetical protein
LLFWRLARYFLTERPSRIALMLYPFWPGLLVFSGRFDVLYAVLALLALWLAQHTLLNGRWWTAVLFGLILAAATWFGLGTLAIAGMVNVILLAQIGLGTVNGRSGFGRLLMLNGFLSAALLLFWGGLWLVLGVAGPAVFALSQELHQKFRIIYPLWPLFNLFDLAVFMGIVPFCGALAGMVKVGGRVLTGQREFRPADALIVGWLVVVIGLNLSGQVRAETGRLWLFLMGPGILAGIAGWSSWLKGSGSQKKWEGVLIGAFLVQALVTGAFLGGRAPETSVPEPVWQTADGTTPVSYDLGDSIALKGYRLDEQNGRVELNLYWQALDYPRQDYAVFAHLLDAEGEIMAQDDGPPQAGGLPTWCWIPGEVVEDRREFTAVESDEAANIGVGIYDWQTGIRLIVEPAAKDNTIIIPLTSLNN